MFAFDQLFKWSDHLTTIAVATPAGRTFDDGPYLTFESDGVINNIPAALPPNIEKADPGLFDHRFVEDYLASKNTRSQIFETMAYGSELNGNDNALFDEGNFNEDLDRVVMYYRSSSPAPRMEPPQCLVYWLLADMLHSIKSENWNGDSDEYRVCNARKKKSLMQRIDDCIWDLDPRHRTFGECVFSGLFGGQPRHLESETSSMNLVKTNPHCDWHSLNDLRTHLTLAGAIRAKQWLNVMTTSKTAGPIAK